MNRLDPVKAGIDIGTVGAVASYWFSLLPATLSIIVMLLAGAYHVISIYYLLKDKHK